MNPLHLLDEIVKHQYPVVIRTNAAKTYVIEDTIYDLHSYLNYV